MIIRDPVHGLIDLSGEALGVLRQLLDTKEVQRLRRIRQLGVTSMAFPGAEHSRFGHSLGTAQVMLRLWRTLEGKGLIPQGHDTSLMASATAAALLHDVGHPPLSHLLEEALPDIPVHERWSLAVVRSEHTEVGRVLTAHGLTEQVGLLLEGRHEARYLCDAISSPLDVDRFDYLLRDSHHCGAGYGVYDLDWMLSSLLLAQIGPQEGYPKTAYALAVDGRRGLRAVEGYLMARLSMFQQVYFHKTSRAAEFMFSSALRRVRALLADGKDVSPLPAGLRELIVGNMPSLEDYLALDDPLLWYCLRQWAGSNDAILSKLCSGLLHRKLLRTVPFCGLDRHSNEEEEKSFSKMLRQRTAEAGYDPDFFCGLDRAVDVPYHVDPGASERIWVVGLGQPRPLGEVSPIVDVLRGWRVGRTIAICPKEVRDLVAKELV